MDNYPDLLLNMTPGSQAKAWLTFVHVTSCFRPFVRILSQVSCLHEDPFLPFLHLLSPRASGKALNRGLFDSQHTWQLIEAVSLTNALFLLLYIQQECKRLQESTRQVLLGFLPNVVNSFVCFKAVTGLILS